jgi:hypothetical protein
MKSIRAFFWFLYEVGSTVRAKARGFFTFPLNASFSLRMSAQHKIENSMSDNWDSCNQILPKLEAVG